jgi:hypothetical protein
VENGFKPAAGAAGGQSAPQARNFCDFQRFRGQVYLEVHLHHQRGGPGTTLTPQPHTTHSHTTHRERRGTSRGPDARSPSHRSHAHISAVSAAAAQPPGARRHHGLRPTPSLRRRKVQSCAVRSVCAVRAWPRPTLPCNAALPRRHTPLLPPPSSQPPSPRPPSRLAAAARPTADAHARRPRAAPTVPRAAPIMPPCRRAVHCPHHMTPPAVPAAMPHRPATPPATLSTACRLLRRLPHRLPRHLPRRLLRQPPRRAAAPAAAPSRRSR